MEKLRKRARLRIYCLNKTSANSNNCRGQVRSREMFTCVIVFVDSGDGHSKIISSDRKKSRAHLQSSPFPNSTLHRSSNLSVGLFVRFRQCACFDCWGLKPKMGYCLQTTLTIQLFVWPTCFYAISSKTNINLQNLSVPKYLYNCSSTKSRKYLWYSVRWIKLG